MRRSVSPPASVRPALPFSSGSTTSSTPPETSHDLCDRNRVHQRLWPWLTAVGRGDIVLWGRGRRDPCLGEHKKPKPPHNHTTQTTPKSAVPQTNGGTSW